MKLLLLRLSWFLMIFGTAALAVAVSPWWALWGALITVNVGIPVTICIARSGSAPRKISEEDF